MTDDVSDLAVKILRYVEASCRAPRARRLQIYAERLALTRRRKALTDLLGREVSSHELLPVRGGYAVLLG